MLLDILFAVMIMAITVLAVIIIAFDIYNII